LLFASLSLHLHLPVQISHTLPLRIWMAKKKVVVATVVD
jgi:hypothetical protein